MDLCYYMLLVSVHIPGKHHADGGNPVDIVLLRVSKSKNIEGFVHDLHFLSVIDRLDFDLAHRHQRIVVDVVGELAGLVEIDLVGDHEVEDVVGPLVRGLVSHTRLLQQVGLNISAGHLAHVVEPDG